MPDDTAPQAAGDCIQLRGLVVLAYCGVLPEEQTRPQPLAVDLDLHLDLRPAGASDALEDTVDYGELCSLVERVLTGERYALLERAAARVAALALDDERVQRVDVSVRKLRPPVPQQLDTTGVRITRTR